LEKMGALDVQIVVHQHQGWRLISCMWLRAGVFHVLANMLSLVFMHVLSCMYGHIHKYFDPQLAALLTVLFIIIITLAVGILPHVDNFAHIGVFVSGFLLGFLFLIRPQFTWLTQQNASPGHVTTPVKSKHKTYQYVLWVLSWILLIVGYTLGLVALFRGVNLNNHSSWCHYLSCVPTSKWNCKSQNIYCLIICGTFLQIGNQLNLTCVSNGRNGTYSLSDPSPSRTQQLYAELCS
ncbi:hypothetical protein D8674_041348, partial [Pyrus ussuriensis x Pyrus communis]